MEAAAGAHELTKECLDATNGDAARALLLAARLTRWQLIAAGTLAPDEDEPLPSAVRRAREA